MPEFSDFNDAEVRKALKDRGVVEAHRLVAEYKCYREHKDGGTQDVLVRIYDMGPQSPLVRYKWEVSVPGAEESEPISANPDQTITLAGYKPYWDKLDDPKRRG